MLSDSVWKGLLNVAVESKRASPDSTEDSMQRAAQGSILCKVGPSEYVAKHIYAARKGVLDLMQNVGDMV